MKVMFCADKIYHGRICRGDGCRSAGGAYDGRLWHKKAPARGATRQKICGRPDGSPAYPEEKNSRL